MPAYAIIRVRGQANVNHDIAYTMKLFGVNKVNHCAVVPVDKITTNMVNVIKDYCTFGVVNAETLAEMIRQRGKSVGDRPIDDEYIKENTDYSGIDDFAEAVASGSARIKDVNGMKPVFRLHPPIKGYEGNKRSFVAGGSLGNRGDKINDLIARML